MNSHPTHCLGPGACPRCDEILAARTDRTPVPLSSAERDRQAAARAEYDPASGLQCDVTWRDGWGCTGDDTGLHRCRKYGPHTVHGCDSQIVTDRELAEGRKPGDLPAWVPPLIPTPV